MLSNTLFLKWELRRQFGVKVKNHSFNFIHSNFIYWEFKLKKTFLEGYNSSWISQISACFEQRLCLLFWTVFWRMSMHLPALIRRDSVFLWSKMQVCLYSCETEIMSICEAEGAIGLLLCIKDSDSLNSGFSTVLEARVSQPDFLPPLHFISPATLWYNHQLQHVFQSGRRERKGSTILCCGECRKTTCCIFFVMRILFVAKTLHILAPPLSLWSSFSELSEMLCPELKFSVLSAK